MPSKKIDIYILNQAFRQRMCIDYYISMNWKRSLYGDGECEIVVPIKENTNDQWLAPGNYIARPDDDMICQIQYVETQTGVDGADTLLIKGADITLLILNKRIVWTDIVYSGSVVGLFQKFLDENFSKKAAVKARRMIAEDGHDLISLNVVGSSGSDSFTYKSKHENIGDAMAQICETFHYGMLMTIERAEVTIKAQSIDAQGHVTTYDLPIRTDRYKFVLNLYKPTNRSNYVIFAENFDNIISTNFASEFEEGKNLMLIGGETADDGTRYYQPVGTIKSGFNRNEKFVDASDITRNINWEDVLNQYPMDDKIFHFPYATPAGSGKGGRFNVYGEYENNEIALEDLEWSVTDDGLFYTNLADSSDYATVQKADATCSTYTVVPAAEVRDTEGSIGIYNDGTYNKLICKTSDEIPTGTLTYRPTVIYMYNVPVFKIPVEDENQLNGLITTYRNSDKVWGVEKNDEDGYMYFYIESCDIALFSRDILNNPPHYNITDPINPSEKLANEFIPDYPDDPYNGGGTFTCRVLCTATDILYSAMLIDEGYKEYQPYTETLTFSAEIDPFATFKYKEDYILGDYVGIRNKYYIKGVVQIVEITETVDSSGYHFDVSLSDAKSINQIDTVIYCMSDVADGIYILDDETGKYIVL